MVREGWGMALCREARILAALVLLLAPAAAKPLTPRFKWGQTKELLFVSVVMRDLDTASVAVALPSEGALQFRARTAKGDEVALDLPLREDVKQGSLKWEISPRPDKWGTAVVVTLGKQNEHRWDLLVSQPKLFKGFMDKDWAREDQSLEPDEEVAYVEEHSEYMTALTAQNLNKTIEKYGAVVANVRYPWCSQCKTQDENFAKAAKLAKAKAKQDKSWKNVAFGVVDAREERELARTLGAKCDLICEYRVFTAVGEDPAKLKSKWNDAELLGDVVKYLSPAVTVLQTEADVAAAKDNNTTCVGSFASEDSPKYRLFKRVAGLMRGELVFAATFGEERALQLWPHKQNVSLQYDGTWEDDGTALFGWIRPRSIPLVQRYDWQLRETYEKLGLPLAKVWINDEDKNPSLEKTVRHIVRRVAKKYIGKIAFVEQGKSSYSYELRDYGLNQPEVYPAFGIAGNATHNAVKYGFEVTPDIAASVQEFWSDADKAVEKLAGFCEQVLAGSWPEAHESASPRTDWSKGTLKHLVWKTYNEIAAPNTPLLLEVFGKYRENNERRLVEAVSLAKALASHADRFAVASYDASENYLPPDQFKRDKYSSDTEWFWVPTDGSGIKKLMKPKKDAPIKNVLEFVKKQSGLEVDVKDLMVKFNFAAMMEESLRTPTTTPGSPVDESDDSDTVDLDPQKDANDAKAETTVPWIQDSELRLDL